MRVPESCGVLRLLRSGWNVWRSAAWEAAVNCSEMAALGSRGWWWRLHLTARRLYWSDPAVHVVLREGPQSGQSQAQCVYGETPALSMLSMLRRVDITTDDVLYDLGCGRGLAMLAAACEFGVQATGVDILPTFIERGRRISDRLGLTRVSWIQGNMLSQDLSDGSIFYLASTTWEAAVMQALATKLSAPPLPARPRRVITLSQPLGDPFRIVGRGSYPMTWGWNTVFFHTLDASI
jgi:SAM-dependent methyltransferase